MRDGGRDLVELLTEYDWLIGLLVGFFLNQIAFIIGRYWKSKDTKMEFRKHILFIKHQLNYIALDIQKMPTTQFMDGDYRERYVKALSNLREEILSIDKSAIPAYLSQELAMLSSDLNFFIVNISRTNIGKQTFSNEEEVNIAKEVAESIQKNVKKIFRYLSIEYKI